MADEKKDKRPWYKRKINQSIAIGLIGTALLLNPTTAPFSPWIIRLAEGWCAYGIGSRISRTSEDKP